MGFYREVISSRNFFSIYIVLLSYAMYDYFASDMIDTSKMMAWVRGLTCCSRVVVECRCCKLHSMWFGVYGAVEHVVQVDALLGRKNAGY